MQPEETPESGRRSRASQMREMQRLLSALQARAAELPHLKAHTEMLEARLRQLEELIRTQAALTEARMDATQKVTAAMSSCERLATVLRLTLKLHYGRSAEKLKDFGIEPWPPKPAGPQE